MMEPGKEQLVNWSLLSEATSAGMQNVLTQWLRKVLVMVLAVVAVVDHVLHIPGDPPPDGTCPHKSPRRTYAGMVNGGEFSRALYQRAYTRLRDVVADEVDGGAERLGIIRVEDGSSFPQSL